MDSTSVAGGLQEPEAPEVMFEVFPPAWDRGLGMGVQCPEVPKLRVGKGDVSSWACWGRGAPRMGPTACLCSPGPLQLPTRPPELSPLLTQLPLQLLWARLELDVTGQLHIQDEELASTRPGRRLGLLLQHHVPSDLEGAERRLQQFQDLRKGPPLSPWDFEQLLLTGVSCVYRLHKALEAEERGRWAQVFALLAQETLWDLCKGFCPEGQPPSLGPWASILDPFP